MNVVHISLLKVQNISAKTVLLCAEQFTNYKCCYN